MISSLLLENETIEFKTSFQKEVIISIVAFANTKGGKVFVGLDDDANVIGMPIESETIQNYINQIKSSTEPSLIVDVQIEKTEGKSVLILSIDEFPVKPVGYKGKYFKRVNDSERFVLSDNIDDSLAKLNLLKENKPTHAAMLLFAKEQNIYNIHVGRFKTASTIIDDKMIRETLYEAVEKTMRYIISWMKVAFEFTGEIQRTEIMEYPISAIRELVINAVIHRDYTSPIDTQIKIFDQHISIFNPGTLYGDITIDKLKTDTYQAQTRNKLIAEAFYLTKDIEKYGSGYTRVRKELEQYPTMKFNYEEMGNGYLVTVAYETQKTTTQETKVSTRELIIQYIKDNSKITRDELALKIGISANAIKQQLAKLKEEKLLTRVGSTKAGYWRIND
ncbi:MAG: ATP-dependent DNA helicase [Sulfurovum sp.]|nr:MAG: ATP-dependent DNA helicase [Sulfurovum sp.]